MPTPTTYTFCLPDYGYGKNPKAVREFNDLLVEKGDPKAIKRKTEGLLKGTYGYEKNLKAAKEFNEFLIEKGNVEAIMRKVIGLAKGTDGYEQDSAAAREFIENLLMSEITIIRAIGKYVKAFAQKYGILELGYKKESEKAIEFIKEHHVPY